jgi:hypothetical protein
VPPYDTLMSRMARMTQGGWLITGAAMIPARRRWPQWLPPLLVILATFVVFLPALSNEFVDWDDEQMFLENPYYRGFSLAHLRWMWTATHMGHYIPLTWMTLGLDYLLWGMDPTGYHLTNVLLHTANALLVYFIALRLLTLTLSTSRIEPWGLRIGAGCAALLFGVHPLRVESVAWATERRDVLCGVFYLLAVHLYLRYWERRLARDRYERRWYAGSVACHAAALLSKSMAVTLPVLLLLLDVYPLRRLDPGAGGWFGRERRQVWAEKLPFAVLSAGAGIGALIALGSFGSSRARSLTELGVGGRAAVSAYSLAFYLGKTVWPVDLGPLYEFPPRVSALARPFLIAELFTLAACLVVILSRRQWPALAAVWAAYIAILLPVVGIIHNGPQLVADRYTYLSCLGWAVLAGAAVAAMWGTRGEWGGRLRRASTGALVASVVATLGFLTWGQAQVWRDSETLWTQALSASPSAQAHNHLGVTFALDGRRDEAVWQFMEALRMWPAFPEAHISLGAVLASEGRLPEAVAHYEIALRINPRLAKAHNNMGEALAGQGSPEVAIEHFRRALVIDPGFTEAQRNLDRVLRGQGLSSSSR